jgi:hypothetical protein
LPHSLRLASALESTLIQGVVRRALSARILERKQRGQLYERLTTHEWRFAARVFAGYRIGLGPLVLIPAGGLELSLLRQSYLRKDESTIRQSYGALPVNLALGFAAGPQLWVEAPLWGNLFASLGALLWIRGLNADHQAAVTLAAEGELSLGYRF